MPPPPPPPSVSRVRKSSRVRCLGRSVGEWTEIRKGKKERRKEGVGVEKTLRRRRRKTWLGMDLEREREKKVS